MARTSRCAHFICTSKLPRLHAGVSGGLLDNAGHHVVLADHQQLGFDKVVLESTNM